MVPIVVDLNHCIDGVVVVRGVRGVIVGGVVVVGVVVVGVRGLPKLFLNLFQSFLKFLVF